MKKGKIVLGAAALLMTVGSTLAFKVANRFNGKSLVFVPTSTGSTSCVQCHSARSTTTLGKHLSSCLTAANVGNVLHARNSFTFFTVKGPNGTCENPVTRTTLKS